MGETVVSDGQFGFLGHVPSSALDEDWGEDEVYAIMTVGEFGDFHTNKVKGHF